MHLSKLLASLAFGQMIALGAPVGPADAARCESGHVTDASGKQYTLYDTANHDIQTITDKIDGEFMRPVSYSIKAKHACKFWSESTRGVGYLIGEFQGPVEASFGSDWAAFFECWWIPDTGNSVRSV